MPGRGFDRDSQRTPDDAPARRSPAARPDAPTRHIANVRALQGAIGNRAARRVLAPPVASRAVESVQRTAGDQDRIAAFVAKRGHASLLTGFNDDMSETDIIGRLIENFFTRTDFVYDFSSTAPFSHRGDCSVLVREFVTIAQECFGIEEIAAESGSAGYFIPGGGKIVHNANVTGNIDDGAHWFFETHTWAVWRGRPIDVLFGQFGIVSHLAGVQDEYDAKNGSVKYQAGNVTFYLKAGAATNFDRYTTNPSLMLKLGGRK